MIFLGLLLVLLAGGAAILVATEDSARYVLFGYTFAPNHIEMFLAGAAASAALLLGIWMIMIGSRRSAQRRRRLRSARADASDRVAKLENEKRELEKKLDREHMTAESDHATAVHERPDHVTADHGRSTFDRDDSTDDRLVAGRTEETKR